MGGGCQGDGLILTGKTVGESSAMRAFQQRSAPSIAKALRWECAWCGRENARRPVRLE